MHDKPRNSRKTLVRDLIITALVSVILRAVWAMFAKPLPVSDFAGYLNIAYYIIDHHGYPASAIRLPGFPLFLALLISVSRNLTWIIAGTVLLSSVLPITAYLLVERLTQDKRAALAGALICAVNPTFVMFSPVLASEHLFAFFLITAFILTISMQTFSAARIILIALAAAGAILTRGEGIFFVPMLILCLYLFGEGSTAKRIGLGFILGSLVLILVLPWAVRNRLVVGPGAGMSTTGGINFYLGHNPNDPMLHGWVNSPIHKASEIETDQAGYRLGLQYIKEHPGQNLCYILRYSYRLYNSSSYALFWSSRLPPPKGSIYFPQKAFPHYRFYFMLTHSAWYLILGLALCSLLFRKNMSLPGWVLIGSILAANWVCYAVIFWGKARFRYIPEILICTLAGWAVVQAYDRMRAGLARKTEGYFDPSRKP